MQLLINNVNRPAPNITHLLLKFNVDSPVERTLLQPKFHYRLLFIIFIAIISRFIFSCFTHKIYKIDLFYCLNCSCLKVILDMLDKLLKPEINALLHEFGFQVRRNQ